MDIRMAALSLILCALGKHSSYFVNYLYSSVLNKFVFFIKLYSHLAFTRFASSSPCPSVPYGGWVGNKGCEEANPNINSEPNWLTITPDCFFFQIWWTEKLLCNNQMFVIAKCNQMFNFVGHYEVQFGFFTLKYVNIILFENLNRFL